ncbi:MAG: hypothetical protein ACKVT0_11325 [Planctomycetaceae bacterium]
MKQAAGVLMCLSLTACSTPSAFTAKHKGSATDAQVLQRGTAHDGSVDQSAASHPKVISDEHRQLTDAVAKNGASEPVADESYRQPGQVGFADFSTARDVIESEREVMYGGDTSTVENADVGDTMIEQLSHEQTADETTQPTLRPQGSAITFAAALARQDDDESVQSAGFQTDQINDGPMGAVSVDVRKMDPEHVDEYLVDGGDRGIPIHYEGSRIEGVESEDTFGEYHDAAGKPRVVPSNTVAVYAPRFGTLRTITGTETGDAIERLSSTYDTVRDSGIHSRTALLHHRQADELEGVSTRNRASGVIAKNGDGDLAHSTRATQHELLQNVYENSLFVTMGRIDQNEQAWLAKRMQAAEYWESNVQTVIVAGDEALQEVYQAERVDEFSALDEDHKQPGRLRLVKMADKRAAKIGDMVTFTLRYDNLGDRPVEAVRIIDHLTARLELIEESIVWGTADAPLGTWDIADHEEGGTVLSFVLSKSLVEKSGGVITFSCRVR